MGGNSFKLPRLKWETKSQTPYSLPRRKNSEGGTRIRRGTPLNFGNFFLLFDQLQRVYVCMCVFNTPFSRRGSVDYLLTTSTIPTRDFDFLLPLPPTGSEHHGLEDKRLSSSAAAVIVCCVRRSLCRLWLYSSLHRGLHVECGCNLMCASERRSKERCLITD